MVYSYALLGWWNKIEMDRWRGKERNIEKS